MVSHFIVLVAKQIRYKKVGSVCLLQQETLLISTKNSSQLDLRVAGH